MSEELSLAEESSDYPDFNFTLCQLPELEHVIGETIIHHYYHNHHHHQCGVTKYNFVQSYRITAEKCCPLRMKEEVVVVCQPT